MLERFTRKSQGSTTSSLHQIQYEEEHLLHDTNDSIQQEEQPKDHGHLVYWVFFLYGIAMLLPWNVFITASEYFAARFDGSLYQENFQSYFSTYFTVTNMFIFVYILWKQSASNDMQINVMTPIVINAIIFGIMSVSVGTSLGGSDYFWLTLFLMVLTGATTGFFQVAVFAEASRFPPQYVQAVMSGQGIAGVSVAISSILSTLTTTPLEKNDSTTTSDHQLAALIYFSSALMVTVAALAGRIILTRQPFYNYHLQHKVTSDDVPINELRQLVGKSAKLLFTVAFVFIVTLMIFPSITSLIKSNTTTRHSRFNDDDLFVAMHFLIFNVGDWIGRVLPLYLSTFDPLLLLIMAGARVVFIPVFLVCNIVVASERSLPVLISSDGIYFLLLGVFSMTSGWICSLTMMAAPQQPFLHTAVEKSQMGSLMSFALVVGLAIGGCLSFWTRTLV